MAIRDFQLICRVCDQLSPARFNVLFIDDRTIIGFESWRGRRGIFSFCNRLVCLGGFVLLLRRASMFRRHYLLKDSWRSARNCRPFHAMCRHPMLLWTDCLGNRFIYSLLQHQNPTIMLVSVYGFQPQKWHQQIIVVASLFPSSLFPL